MGKLTDNQLQKKVQSISDELDSLGYATAMVVSTKTPNDTKEGETQQCASMQINKSTKGVGQTLCDGMKMLNNQFQTNVTSKREGTPDLNENEEKQFLESIAPVLEIMKKSGLYKDDIGFAQMKAKLTGGGVPAYTVDKIIEQLR